jgi:hypothetical protein
MTLSALTAADQASPPQTQADGTINQIATIGAVRVVSKQTRLTDRPQRAYDREAGTNHLRGVTDALVCGRLTPTTAWVTSPALRRWR